MLAFLAAVLLVSARATAEAACPLPATGQTTCWDSSGMIPCAGTGQDGDIRAGAPLSYTDNGDGTITDNNTGLVWEKQSSDGSIHDMSNTYTWDDAFAVHVAGLNTMNFAGHSDWRLANVKELQSIENYEFTDPSGSPAFTTGCAPGCTVLTCSCTAVSNGNGYWSSTTHVASPSYAFFVDFRGDESGVNGSVSAYSKTNRTSVRAVRGGSSCPPATGQTTCWDSNGNEIPCAGTGQDGDIRAGAPLSYTDNGDGTITDNDTGLVWEKLSMDGSVHDVSNTYTWDNAFAVHVAGLNTMNFAGHSDWRLANVKELQSIVNYENTTPCVSPAFTTGCAPGCTVLTCSCTAVSNAYWSSTPDGYTNAWRVDSRFGYVTVGARPDNLSVRAVRVNPALSVCGDGVVEPGEQCDDGNTVSGDGCSASCQVEPCYTCTGQPSICTPLPSGSSCDNGNSCTQTQCNGTGQCVGSNPVVCTPLDLCHLAGTCDPATGICSNPVIDCPAPDACHSPGTCDPATGRCSNPPVTCTPLDQCHLAGTCDVATGICSNPPVADGTPCDDGNACTQNDTCQGGRCTGTVSCSVDLTGTWDVAYTLAGASSVTGHCVLQINESGAALSMTGPCDAAGIVTLAGTNNQTTRQVNVNGSSQSYCSTLSISGTASVDGNSIAGAFNCASSAFVGSLTFARRPPSPPVCGNGVIDPGEECDDGNTRICDGCTNCRIDRCGDGIVCPNEGEQCDDGNTSNGDGCDSQCHLEPTSVTGTLAAGGSLTSDTGSGATPSQPLQAIVTSPTGGNVTISRSGATTPLPGFTLLTGLMQITAPPATGPSAPLTLTFVIDASLIPPGETQNTIQVTKDGVVVPNCTGNPGEAVPDPCVSARLLLGDGDVQITVLTTTASRWGVAVSICTNTPATGCRKAIVAPLLIQKGASSTDDKVAWKWHGGFTTTGDFDNPVMQTDYALCTYDEQGGIPRRKLGVVARHAGICSGRPCWQETRNGFRYQSTTLAPQGSLKLVLQAAQRGPAKIAVSGKGAALGVPSLPLDQAPAVIVQLRSSDGRCWEGRYSTRIEDDSGRFKAKSD